MLNKLFTYAAIPIIGAGVLVAGTAFAHGFGFSGGNTSLTPDEIAQKQQTMFQNEAQFLGISVDAIKAGWAKGENIRQIAQENGISVDVLQQKRQEVQKEKMTAMIQTLVNKGIITQAQGDQRLKIIQEKQANKDFGKFHRRGLQTPTNTAN